MNELNVNLKDFRSVRKLLEIVDLHGNEEQKRVLPQEIKGMYQGVLDQHFGEIYNKVSKLKREALKEMFDKENIKDEKEYYLIMSVICSVINKHIKEEGIETMDELKDFISASDHTLFGSYMLEQLWYNKK